MITNIFHLRPDLIGINIENVKNEFVICVAFKYGTKWSAKTLSGISGDLNDITLLDKVILIGQNLDKKTANEIFTSANMLGLDYSSK